MSKHKEAHPEVETPESPEERAERINAIIDAAQAGDLEIPSGADDIVEALVEVARERQELNDKLLRTVADFQNFQRRASLNEREAATQARAGVVQQVLTVMDHFDLALAQDPDATNTEQILGGVRVIRDELFKTLQTFGVSRIEPGAGDEFDPNIHEAMLRQASEGIEPGRVVALLSVGYKLGDRVVRPAKVSVAPNEGED
ncbi:MAG: nucleotide exchange factor GrpE [Phycisphaerales bacterium JB059]